MKRGDDSSGRRLREGERFGGGGRVAGAEQGTALYSFLHSTNCWEFPGGRVVRTPRFHCRGPEDRG